MENKWSFLVAKIDSKTSTYATFDDILPDPWLGFLLKSNGFSIFFASLKKDSKGSLNLISSIKGGMTFWIPENA